MTAIDSLIEKGQYFTAWRLVKGLPDSIRESVVDDLLTRINNGAL